MAPDHGFADLVDIMDEIFQREGTVSATLVPGLASTVPRLKQRGLALGIWGMSVQNFRATK